MPVSKTRKSRKQPVRRSPSTGGLATRARIAETVHQAVCAVTGDDGRGHCALYAYTGAVVAGVITGHDYMVQAGELLVDTGDVNEDGRLYFQYSPEQSGYSGYEFHAWFTRHPGGKSGSVTGHGRNHEFVDLSMRHYRQTVVDSGMPWKRGPLPPYFWGPWSQLSALGVRLNVDPTMTTMVLQHDMTAAQEAAQLALKTLRAA